MTTTRRASWETLAEAVFAMATAHSMRNLEARLIGLQDEQRRCFTENRPADGAEIGRQVESLFAPRAEAQERLNAACNALQMVVAELGAINQRETPDQSERDQLTAELLNLATLAEAAKTDFGPTISRIDEATTSIRQRLHSYRRPLLADRVAGIHALLAELEELGSRDTIRLLEQETYLDLPLPEASERLDSEIGYLRGRINEVHRENRVERARRARQQLRELMADGAVAQAERSDDVLTCLRDVADDPDHGDTSIDPVAREVLRALGSSQMPAANRSSRWLSAA